jgi:malonate-semialdehyde dehydrogenase (acetylating)/methylmalonate-semialdehyde dehydrogenase
MQTKVKNFINGKMEESDASKWFDVRNPATQELVCKVPQSTPSEVWHRFATALSKPTYL